MNRRTQPIVDRAGQQNTCKSYRREKAVQIPEIWEVHTNKIWAGSAHTLYPIKNTISG